MNVFKRFFGIALLVFTTTFSSCNKDEIIIPNTTVADNNDSNNNGSNGNNQSQGEEGEITLYKIAGENINKVTDYKVSGKDLAYQKDVSKHNEIWELVKKIVPKNQREKLGEFLIYNGEPTGSAGFVVQIKKDLSSWKMGIAINYAYEGGFNANGELAYTIIHEFGHVLTLNDTQLVASQSNCNTYNPGEGCAKSNSYINELYQKHWKDIWNEYQSAKNKGQEELRTFYEKYKNRYVTAYAATNPPEDIAEVFATFVTRKDKPKGNTIAEKKILLMYNRSELVAFRDHIRKNLNLRGRGTKPAFILPEPGSWKQANKIGKSCRTHKH
ncbi:hypothetical protein WH52_07425 [Tenacibaculum holothuriorum]|uniref:Uncharacterized protein n=1 Tax=Tenacibaculum holothuriorum TaxID=1635173 RepID=A0A1Y2PFI6_9FLAO|nr:hypothetical protein [Tenacibaculum holothuriorum]OSY88567.1 hypothetical protein WH52_07425 [Tenacibaculum holothuriorum]